MSDTPRPIRVGLDGRNLLLPRQTGIGNYANALIRALTSHGHGVEIIGPRPSQRRPHPAAIWSRALLPWPQSCALAPSAPGAPFQSRVAPDLFRAARAHRRLYGAPRLLTGPGPPDIVHWTTPLPLHWRGRPNIHTIHDLFPLHARTETGRVFRTMLAYMRAHSAHVLTVSDSVRTALVTECGFPAALVTNLFQPLDLPAGGAAPSGLGTYDLFVGTAEPRKNLPRIVAAHAAAGLVQPLVIAGLDSFPPPPPLPAGVICLPWLDRPALVRLIAGARMLVQPSLEEGFGLPIAEALALGVPVITANHGPMAEIAGGAALLVDPTDTAAITAAIAALAADPALRARLSQAGRDGASRFDAQIFATNYIGLVHRTIVAWQRGCRFWHEGASRGHQSRNSGRRAWHPPDGRN